MRAFLQGNEARVDTVSPASLSRLEVTFPYSLWGGKPLPVLLSAQSSQSGPAQAAIAFIGRPAFHKTESHLASLLLQTDPDFANAPTT